MVRLHRRIIAFGRRTIDTPYGPILGFIIGFVLIYVAYLLSGTVPVVALAILDSKAGSTDPNTVLLGMTESLGVMLVELVIAVPALIYGVVALFYSASKLLRA